MARVKISEYRAKCLLYAALSIPYEGISFTEPSTLQFTNDRQYVLKVDQGVKKRFLKGLVKVDITGPDVGRTVSEWKDQGYEHFLVEPYIPHSQDHEMYLSFSRVRNGVELLYSSRGGVAIEEHQDSIQKALLDEKLLAELPLPEDIIKRIWECFEKNHLSFLEINPLVKTDTGYIPLDAAVEVDSTGVFFVKGAWSNNDFVSSEKQKSSAEMAITKLSETSQASLSFTLLNPNGSIFLLLSGGGASLVVADEAYQQGMGAEIANYGEYSGNPTAEETYLYTKELLTVLKNSSAQKKVLIIGGGVANFTDIRITFAGVIQALQEFSEELQKQDVKVFVRRGGPNQEEGLKKMKTFLEENHLYGGVYGPEKVLTDIVTEAIGWLKSKDRS